jgi:hypothetical protein
MGAVRCARFGEPPPPELHYYRIFKKCGTFPDDVINDSALMHRMSYLNDVYAIVKRYQTEAHEFDATEWKFIRWLIDEGLYNG